MDEKKHSSVNSGEEDRIIDRCLSGEKDAYTILINRYKNLIYDLVYRMIKDKEEVKDIAQETFVKAYFSLKNFRKECKFSTWLCRIALNKCRDYLRSMKGSNISIDIWEEDLATSKNLPDNNSKINTPDSILLRKEKDEIVQETLEKLPQMYKEVLVLKHIEGLDYNEMETILGVSVNTLKVRTYRAREMFRNLLSIKTQLTTENTKDTEKLKIN